MQLKDFVKNYDLYEITVDKIEYKQGNIYLLISFDIDFHFIANGCRSAFDGDSKHLFIFENQKQIESNNTIQYVKNYTYENGLLTLVLTNQKLTISDCKVYVRNLC